MMPPGVFPNPPNMPPANSNPLAQFSPYIGNQPMMGPNFGPMSQLGSNSTSVGYTNAVYHFYYQCWPQCLGLRKPYLCIGKLLNNLLSSSSNYIYLKILTKMLYFQEKFVKFPISFYTPLINSEKSIICNFCHKKSQYSGKKYNCVRIII